MPHRQMNMNHTTQTTPQSRLKVFGDRSGFHSAAKASPRTSSGLFLPLLLVSSCSLLAGLLLSSSGLYEWFADLNIDRQFKVVAVFCSGALLYAAAVREFCHEPLAQWSGRIAGLAGFILLLTFAWKASVLCSSVGARDHVERHFSEQQYATSEGKQR